ncbi:MAG TPA: SDR family NAD(P)-dependent oxidoreductase [Paracoccaceae bacterium]|nr:SDR family NAD(P)-dependent oxidoreductase [Paracoccaceae bacterium]
MHSLVTYHDLKGRGIFVSGGASGIGADMVRAFHGQGARVTFVDIDEGAASALQAELAGAPQPRFRRCDVTDLASLSAALAEAEGAGGLDVLVNNAANDTRHDWDAVTPEDWERIVAVNLRHQFFAAQAAGRFMQARGRGAIINFASIAPLEGLRRLAVYSTCKAGIMGLTRSLARELGDFGIRVNSIVPGAILTPRQLELWVTPEDEAHILAEQCLHRRLVGADVAQMALFLASDVSSACTGQDFVVDGGLT